MELFHPDVDSSWRDWIFTTIQGCPQHTFIVLTKMPERIDRPVPPNVWLGVSVTGVHDWGRVSALSYSNKTSGIKFVSIEPMLEMIPITLDATEEEIDWFIVGRLTGHGRKHDPTIYQLQRIFDETQRIGRPLFMKNNLSEIWGKPLIQEFPKGANT
jgi:protein gp37